MSSLLLQTSNNIVGSNAYLTDGDYVYTYRLAKVTQIYKDDSMIYTEDDFSEQIFSDEIKKLAPSELTKDVVQNKIWNSDGTYTENNSGQTFKFGKLLTLYTCYLEPYNRTLAYDRIIVTGVQIKKEKMLATMRGYDSVIDYLLAEQDGNRELYDRQIRTLMTDLAPHIRRYIKLLAREHKIEDMQFADCKINLDPDFEVDMTIDESRSYLKKALGVLGEDYVKMIDESYDKRWTDFPQNIGKSTGGFCATVPNVAGFILLSWTGKMNEVFVLAHELGHAYHFMSTGKHQTMLNNDCPLYFVEAPSTCNEVIVSNYLLKTNTDARFKRWVISNMISRTYFHNMVTHYLEAVYQDRVYKKVDNNEMLTAEVLSTIKREVMEEFFGDSLVINEGAELTWMRQPHYYMGLYPYTYSAGLTIGTAIANKIDNDSSYADTWLNVLSKGSSMSALDLSKLAGCDVSTDEPLKEAIAYVGHLVDELYNLTDELNK